MVLIWGIVTLSISKEEALSCTFFFCIFRKHIEFSSNVDAAVFFCEMIVFRASSWLFTELLYLLHLQQKSFQLIVHRITLSLTPTTKELPADCSQNSSISYIYNKRASSWLFTEFLYLLHLQQKSFQLIVHRITLSLTPTTKELPADCSQNSSISNTYNKRASSWLFTELLYLLHLQQKSFQLIVHRIPLSRTPTTKELPADCSQNSSISYTYNKRASSWLFTEFLYLLQVTSTTKELPADCSQNSSISYTYNKRASSWLFTEFLYLLHLQQKSFPLIVHRIPLSLTPTTKELPADCSQNSSISYTYNKRASSWLFTEFLYLLYLQQKSFLLIVHRIPLSLTPTTKELPADCSQNSSISYKLHLQQKSFQLIVHRIPLSLTPTTKELPADCSQNSSISYIYNKRASSWLFTEFLYLLHLQQKSFQLIVHRIPLSLTSTTKELPADCSQNSSISYIYNKRASSWLFTELLYLLHLQQKSFQLIVHRITLSLTPTTKELPADCSQNSSISYIYNKRASSWLFTEFLYLLHLQQELPADCSQNYSISYTYNKRASSWLFTEFLYLLHLQQKSFQLIVHRIPLSLIPTTKELPTDCSQNSSISYIYNKRASSWLFTEFLYLLHLQQKSFQLIVHRIPLSLTSYIYNKRASSWLFTEFLYLLHLQQKSFQLIVHRIPLSLTSTTKELPADCSQNYSISYTYNKRASSWLFTEFLYLLHLQQKSFQLIVHRIPLSLIPTTKSFPLIVHRITLSLTPTTKELPADCSQNSSISYTYNKRASSWLFTELLYLLHLQQKRFQLIVHRIPLSLTSYIYNKRASSWLFTEFLYLLHLQQKSFQLIVHRIPLSLTSTTKELPADCSQNSSISYIYNKRASSWLFTEFLYLLHLQQKSFQLIVHRIPLSLTSTTKELPADCSQNSSISYIYNKRASSWLFTEFLYLLHLQQSWIPKIPRLK